MPTLHIVATPIGNLEDITLRALRVLREVELIAAEDTRVTRRLLSHYDIHTRLTSFNEHNQSYRIRELLSVLRDADVALVSDAGTPGVNDPGQALVNAASEEGFSVVVVPGASAVTSAIAVSGLVDEAFVYLGFLPRRSGERRRLLRTLKGDVRPLIALDSPHRLRQSLQDALEVLGDRHVAVCREMTKLHEEVFRGGISDALKHFDKPRGEFTLILQGALVQDENGADAVGLASSLLREMRLEGAGAKHAVSHVAAVTGLSRRQVYRMWLTDQQTATDADSE